MNETEARRLLAAATEDMPPQIDLLAGFAEARRRDRARRIRGRAVLSAGIAAAAASVTAIALAIGSAPPALATVTSALTRSLAQSYHATEIVSSYYIWNGRINHRSHATCTAEEDPVHDLGMSSCTSGQVDREVGGYAYLYITDPVDHPGRHWLRFPASSADLHQPAFTGFDDITPRQMLSQIKKVSKVTVIGPVSGPGWTGTRYAFASNPQGGGVLNGTVDVDRQGRARAFVLTTRSTSHSNVFVTTQTLTFSAFGAPVTVTPPPADQTYSLPSGADLPAGRSAG